MYFFGVVLRIRTGGNKRNRIDRCCLRIGFDIQSQHCKRWLPLDRRQLGIVVDTVNAVTGLPYVVAKSISFASMTQASLTRYRVGKLSLPSTTMS